MLNSSSVVDLDSSHVSEPMDQRIGRIRIMSIGAYTTLRHGFAVMYTNEYTPISAHIVAYCNTKVHYYKIQQTQK